MGHNLTDDLQAEEIMRKDEFSTNAGVTCSPVQCVVERHETEPMIGGATMRPVGKRPLAVHDAAPAVRERVQETRGEVPPIALRPALEAVLRAVPPPMPGHARSSRVALAVDFLRAAYDAIDWGAASHLERQRDDARAEVERLRHGRAELEGMYRAAVDEVRRLAHAGEALARVLGRVVPDASALVVERREALDLWGIVARDGR